MANVSINKTKEGINIQVNLNTSKQIESTLFIAKATIEKDVDFKEIKQEIHRVFKPLRISYKREIINKVVTIINQSKL